MRAVARGLRVLELPITTQARQRGESNVDALRASSRMLFDISRFRRQDA